MNTYEYILNITNIEPFVSICFLNTCTSVKKVPRYKIFVTTRRFFKLKGTLSYCCK